MRSRLPLLIIIISLLIVGLIVTVGLLNRLRQIRAQLPAIVRTQLQTSLNREMEFRQVRLVGSDTVIIEDLRVADGKTFDDGILFTADRVLVRLRGYDLITGRTSLIRSVSSVTLTSPNLNLSRDAGNVWNIDDLLKRPPAAPGERFRGIINIRGGSLSVTDYAAGLAALPAVNKLTSIDGNLDFRPDDYFRIDVSGNGEKGRLGFLALNGKFGIDPTATDLRTTVREANAGYWYNYFFNIESWNIGGGALNASARITNPSGKKLQINGTGKLSDSSLTSPYLTIPIRPLEADLRMRGDVISFDGEGFLRRDRVTASGNFAITDPSKLDIVISSSRINFNTVQAAVKVLPKIRGLTWPAPGSFRVRITGAGTNTRYTASLQSPRAVFDGTSITGITASGSYRQGILSIDNYSGRVAGGSISGTASINTQTGRSTTTGTARNINLAGLPITPSLQARGITNLNYTLGSMRGVLSGRIRAAVGRGSVSGFAFTSGDADISLAGRDIIIRNAVLDSTSGMVRASGRATTTGRLNLNLQGNNINLASLLGPLGYRDITGTANFTGTLTGTTSNPVLAGSVTARNGRIRTTVYDLLTGRINATPQRVVLSDAVIVSRETRVATVGTIVIARGAQPAIDLRVQTDRTPVEELFGLLGITLRATGTATADLTVRGAYPDIALSGTISIENGSLGGFAFDTARLRAQSIGGRTVIQELTATRGDMRVVGSGTISPEGALAINIAGENLDLNLLNDVLAPYAVFSGPLTAEGRIGGTLSQPTFSAGIASTAPVVNSIPFDSFTAGVAWDGTRLSMTDAQLYGNQSRYDIPLLRFRPGTVPYTELQATISTTDIQSVFTLVRNSPFTALPRGARVKEFVESLPTPFTGPASASIRAAGPLDNLNGGVSIKTAGILMGTSTITQAEMEIVSQGSLVSVNRASIQSSGVNLSASAQFVEAAPTQFTSGITDTSLPALIELINNASFLKAFSFGEKLISTIGSIPEPAAGTIDASISLANIQEGATGTVTARGAGVNLGGNVWGDVNLDAALNNGVIAINRLSLTPPGGSVNVIGTIDMSQGVSITGTARDFPLDVLNAFIPGVELSGRINSDFTATGPVENPRVTASLSAGNVSTDGVTFENLSAERILIADGKLTTGEIILRKGNSSLVASASVPFMLAPPFIIEDEPLEIRGRLVDQNLELVRTFTKEIEDATGDLTADILVTGTIADLSYSGSLNLINGFINLTDFENDFTDVNLTGTFRDSTLFVESLSAASTLGGTVSASGALSLPGGEGATGNLTANLESLRLHEINLAGGEENFTFTANGQLSATGIGGNSSLTGQLVVNDAVLSVPAKPVRTTGQVPSFPINPTLSVNIDLANNVEVRRGALRAEVVGPLSLTGTASRPALAGTVQITAGELRYVGRTFTITPGGLASILLQPPQPAVIVVSLAATARITAASPLTGFFTRYTIILEINGPISNPEVDIRSNPPGLTELEALSLILPGTALNALVRGVPAEVVIQEEFPQILLGFAVPEIFAPIDLGGLTLTLEPGLNTPIIATIGTALDDRLFLSYSRSVVGRDPFDVFSLSYTLSPQLAVTAQWEGQYGSPQETSYLIQYFTRY